MSTAMWFSRWKKFPEEKPKPKTEYLVAYRQVGDETVSHILLTAKSDRTFLSVHSWETLAFTEFFPFKPESA